MKLSIKNKIIVSYLVIIVFSILFVAILVNLATRRYLEKQEFEKLQSSTILIAGTIAKNNEAIDTPAKKAIWKIIDGKISTVIKHQDVSYVIFSDDLKSFNSPENDTLLLNKISRKISNRLSNINTRFRIFHDNSEYIVQVVDMKRINKSSSGVLAGFSKLDELNEIKKTFNRIVLVGLIISGLLALIIGFIIARSITKPIRQMKKRTELISKRNFDYKIPVNSQDELQILSSSIDSMAQTLKNYDLSQKKFLQNASHELKTPLMSIQGYAEGIKDDMFDDNNQALDIIIEESIRLKKIVNDIIYLTKLETLGDFYSFSINNLNDIINGSIQKVNSLAMQKSISIKSNLTPDIFINSDNDKLTQAFINILGNCIRYATKNINIFTTVKNKTITIKIYDDGSGFTENDIKHVFDRFYKNKKGSIGLGLTITKVIIENHNGSISVSNKVNGGAEFTIQLIIV